MRTEESRAGVARAGVRARRATRRASDIFPKRKSALFRKARQKTRSPKHARGRTVAKMWTAHTQNTSKHKYNLKNWNCARRKIFSSVPEFPEAFRSFIIASRASPRLSPRPSPRASPHACALTSLSTSYSSPPIRRIAPGLSAARPRTGRPSTVSTARHASPSPPSRFFENRPSLASRSIFDAIFENLGTPLTKRTSIRSRTPTCSFATASLRAARGAKPSRFRADERKRATSASFSSRKIRSARLACARTPAPNDVRSARSVAHLAVVCVRSPLMRARRKEERSKRSAASSAVARKEKWHRRA